MDHLRQLLQRTWPAVLAVVVVGLLPLVADAGGIYFRNETNTTLYVRGASINPANGKLMPWPLLTIPPGKFMYDPDVPKGDRYITITDPNNRLLFNDVLRAYDGNDLALGIVPVLMKGPPKVMLEKRMLPK
jgi:hypothetical protein